MAPVLPDARTAMIAWFRQRADLWETHAGALGLPPELLADLSARLDEAEGKRDQANAIRAASEGVTLEYHTSADGLRDLGAGLIALIKARADAATDPALYALAQVPPPSPRSPLGPPPRPTGLSSTLGPLGKVTLSWKCTRRGGTSFAIYRALTAPGQPTGPFTLIGTSEAARFTDAGVPVGLASATYYVIAHRSAGASPASDTTIIYFGAAATAAPQAGTGVSLAA